LRILIDLRNIRRRIHVSYCFFHIMRENLFLILYYLSIESSFWGQSTWMNNMASLRASLRRSSSFTFLLISSLWKEGNLYCSVFMDLSSVMTILCTVISLSNNRNKSLHLLMILSTWIASSLLRSKRKSSCRKWPCTLNIIDYDGF